MVGNILQFAVVREDPLIEIELVKLLRAKKALLVASGGCVALSLKACFPELKVSLFDFNAAQLEHVKKKIDQLSNSREEFFRQAFNIETSDPAGLNERGNFESLFRGFRGFVHDLVAPYDEFRSFFESPSGKNGFLDRIFHSKYWSVGFQVFFCDVLLNAMFSPAATQHAPKDSYPGYFQRVLEEGLGSSQASENYFLHHIFLGHYLDRPNGLPIYLRGPIRKYELELIEGALEKVPDLEEYDLISLSNIMDWMSDSEVNALAHLVRDRSKEGSALVFRQLNNFSDFQTYFKPVFTFDENKAEELLRRDRSLFYCKLSVGCKR